MPVFSGRGSGRRNLSDLGTQFLGKFANLAAMQTRLPDKFLKSPPGGGRIRKIPSFPECGAWPGGGSVAERNRGESAGNFVRGQRFSRRSARQFAG